MRPEQHRKRFSDDHQNEAGLRTGSASIPATLPALCRQVQTDLPAFLDDDLSISRRQVVHRHLENCEACSLELATYRDLERTLSQARLAIPAAGDLRPGFYARLAATERSQGSGFDLVGRWLTDWRVLIPGLAAASLLIGLWQGSHLAPSGLTSQMASQSVAKVPMTPLRKTPDSTIARVPSEKRMQSHDGASMLKRLRASSVASASKQTGRHKKSRLSRAHDRVLVASLLPSTAVGRYSNSYSMPEQGTNLSNGSGKGESLFGENLAGRGAVGRPGSARVTESDTTHNSAQGGALVKTDARSEQPRSLAASALRDAPGKESKKSEIADKFPEPLRGDEMMAYSTSGRARRSDTTTLSAAFANRNGIVPGSNVDDGVDIQVTDRRRGFTSSTRVVSSLENRSGLRVLQLEVADENTGKDSKASGDAQESTDNESHGNR